MLRKQKGLTLKKLAEKTKLTESFLSKAERDINTPSFTTLQKIATELGVTIGYFFLSSNNRVKIVRKNQRQVVINPGSRVKWEILSEGTNKMQLASAIIKPGEVSSEEPYSHEGYECQIVLQGRMECIIDHEKFVLEEGDSINFNSGIPHKLRNIGDKELRVLVCIFIPI